MMALWVALFYLIMMQIMGNAVAPIVRSSQMKLHPASLLFSVLAMGLAFGALGALIATPIAGVFKAFYDEFFASKRAQPDEECVTALLEGKMPESNAPESNAPESNAPESNAPESNAPESNAPESNAPESNTPESNHAKPNAEATS